MSKKLMCIAKGMIIGASIGTACGMACCCRAVKKSKINKNISRAIHAIAGVIDNIQYIIR